MLDTIANHDAALLVDLNDDQDYDNQIPLLMLLGVSEPLQRSGKMTLMSFILTSGHG